MSWIGKSWRGTWKMRGMSKEANSRTILRYEFAAAGPNSESISCPADLDCSGNDLKLPERLRFNLENAPVCIREQVILSKLASSRFNRTTPTNKIRLPGSLL